MTTDETPPGSQPVDAQAVTDALVRHWSRLLGETQIGYDDDFFELGGHSLLVGRVAAELNREFGIEVPFAAFFDYPTARQLGEEICAGRAAEQATRDQGAG